MSRACTVSLVLGLCGLFAGCAGGGKIGLSSKDGLDASGSLQAQRLKRGTGGAADPKGTGDPRCDATVVSRSQSEFDTNEDGNRNVRKVYYVRGGTAEGSSGHSQLICREADVNGDGVKDLIRTYDDEGQSLREDADRNFDGKIDMTIVYQHGKIVTKEFDQNYDGVIDGKTFFEGGRAVRTELDLKGLSTPQQWRPTQWQYFEEGGIVRMGTDLDGDSKIDRWERDQTRDKTAAADAEGGDAEGEAGDEAADGEGTGDGAAEG